MFEFDIFCDEAPSSQAHPSLPSTRPRARSSTRTHTTNADDRPRPGETSRDRTTGKGTRAGDPFPHRGVPNEADFKLATVLHLPVLATGLTPSS